MKQAIWRHLMDYDYESPLAKQIRLGILVLIVINCVAVILESVESLEAEYGTYFRWLELTSVVLFSVEYVLRLWVVTCNPKFSHPVWGRLRWAVSPFGLIDLFSILPALFIGSDLRSLRILRLVRLFRILKIARYSYAFRALGTALKQKHEEMVVTLFVLLILLVLTSSLIYAVEKDAQPEAFSSIPAAMWWSIVTLSTVGYGDVYPSTNLGRLVGALAALLGVGLFAMPAAILAGGFIDNLSAEKQKTAPTNCPHCGKPIDEPAS